MMLMIIAVLVVLGLCAGSFINALVYRLHWQEKNPKASNKYSILSGRSICPSCKHILSPMDLIPVLSWLVLKGKCRYCYKPISIQYPLVEASTAGLFILSYLFWPSNFHPPADGSSSIFQFSLWLIILTGLIALAVYDIRWMILPNKIIFPLIVLALGSILAQFALTTDYDILATTVVGAAVGGGIFYILFQVSGGKWIGGGDVKLGFLLGVITGGPLSAFLMLFIASLAGSIFSLPLIAKNRLGSKTKIAFGPFLIFAAIIVTLFGDDIISVYNNLLML